MNKLTYAQLEQESNEIKTLSQCNIGPLKAVIANIVKGHYEYRTADALRTWSVSIITDYNIKDIAIITKVLTKGSYVTTTALLSMEEYMGLREEFIRNQAINSIFNEAA
jgi:hypothetical protein